jgi:hypothetical protein
MRKTRCQILHKKPCSIGAASAEVPAGYKFRIGADGRQNPYVTTSPAPLVAVHVPLLAADEGPDFVTLDPLAGKVHKCLALEIKTNRPDVPRAASESQTARVPGCGLLWVMEISQGSTTSTLSHSYS